MCAGAILIIPMLGVIWYVKQFEIPEARVTVKSWDCETMIQGRFHQLLFFFSVYVFSFLIKYCKYKFQKFVLIAPFCKI